MTYPQNELHTEKGLAPFREQVQIWNIDEADQAYGKLCSNIRVPHFHGVAEAPDHRQRHPAEHKTCSFICMIGSN